jgi:uncharacterized protein
MMRGAMACLMARRLEGNPMSQLGTGAAPVLEPIRATERIHALDIIRGLALVGIFLMNVEWFVRPIADLGSGVDVRQTGWSYVASWMIYTFVQGKFWTMFSLLFGMGFAVMLTRAEARGSEFTTPYVRRLLALFLFGSMHFVLIWTGDILHNYAITALALLLIVTRNWKAWAGIAVSLAVVGLALRTGAVAASLALLAITAPLMVLLNRGPLSRWWQCALGLYLVPCVAGLVFAGALAVKAPEQPTAKEAAQRQEQLAERARARTEEVRVMSSGTWAEATRWRAKEYRDDLPTAPALGIFALPLFMLGVWFVRSGVVERWRDHLPLFRRLLAWCLPIGLGITLASVWLMPSFDIRAPRSATMMAARVLQGAGAGPLCLAYVSAIFLLLSTRTGERILSPLRHAGRMALTNYLGASLAGTWYSYGYGLGHFGQVSRAGQVGFVAIVFGLQLIFSKLWLSQFRYGPMEWLWRAATYWHWPAMRRERAPVSTTLADAGGA